MLFMAHYRIHDGRTSLNRFTQWTPPAGFTFKSHYQSVDGRNGFALVEANSTAAIFEAVVTFADTLEFDVHPVIDINEGVPIQMRAHQWADEVDDAAFGDEEG